ncbi:MAG: type IV pilus assembly protein PilO, partial [Colwellia sp.]
MNIDLTQFFEQFEGLEADNVGQWPKAAKITLAVFIAIVVFVLGYFLLISDKITTLDNY